MTAYIKRLTIDSCMQAQIEFTINVTQDMSAADVERELILKMLVFKGGNKFQTAVRLKIHPSTMVRKLKEYSSSRADLPSERNHS